MIRFALVAAAIVALPSIARAECPEQTIDVRPIGTFATLLPTVATSIFLFPALTSGELNRRRYFRGVAYAGSGALAGMLAGFAVVHRRCDAQSWMTVPALSAAGNALLASMIWGGADDNVRDQRLSFTPSFAPILGPSTRRMVGGTATVGWSF